MIRFFLIGALLIALTDNSFITEDYYVVEKFCEKTILLEPLESENQNKIIRKKTFPDVQEGIVVSVIQAGNLLVKINSDPEITSQRKEEINKLLQTLTKDR